MHPGNSFGPAGSGPHRLRVYPTNGDFQPPYFPPPSTIPHPQPSMDFPPHHHHHPHHPYLNPDPYLPLNGYNVPHQSQQYPTTADRHYLLGPDPMQRGFGGTGGYDPRRIGAPVHGDYMTTSSSTGVGMSNTLLSHHRTSSPLQELHDPPSMHNNHRLHYQTRELDDQVRDPFYSILFYSTTHRTE